MVSGGTSSSESHSSSNSSTVFLLEDWCQDSLLGFVIGEVCLRWDASETGMMLRESGAEGRSGESDLGGGFLLPWIPFVPLVGADLREGGPR